MISKNSINGNIQGKGILNLFCITLLISRELYSKPGVEDENLGYLLLFLTACHDLKTLL